MRSMNREIKESPILEQRIRSKVQIKATGRFAITSYVIIKLFPWFVILIVNITDVDKIVMEIQRLSTIFEQFL